MKIIADNHIAFVQHYFAHAGELVLKPGRTLTAAEVRDADILLVRSITRVDEALLKDSRVKFVGSVTAGADHLDGAWLDRAGIAWSVAAGFNAPPVADYVMSVLAALQQEKKLAETGLKIAVVGVGHVGRLVVEYSRALGHTVIKCDPLRAEQEKDTSFVRLQDIAEVDVVSLHVPLTQEGEHATHHFIAAEFLQRQKPGCVLINTARGAVLDSQAFKKHGKHLLGCFDVWENEPNIDKEILAQATIATPHIAGYSTQAKLRGIEMIYRRMLEMGIIQPGNVTSLALPQPTWRDMALAIFNLRYMKQEMQKGLFDTLREEFFTRDEFKGASKNCHTSESWYPESR